MTLKMKNKKKLTICSTAVLIFAASAYHFKKKRSKKMSEKNNVKVTVNDDLVGKIRGLRREVPIIEDKPDIKIEFTENNIENSLNLDEVRKRELIARFEAMSIEEQKLLLEIIPAELCIERINSELIKARNFRDTVSNAICAVM